MPVSLPGSKHIQQKSSGLDEVGPVLTKDRITITLNAREVLGKIGRGRESLLNLTTNHNHNLR